MMTIALSKTNPTMSELFEVEVTDDSDPTLVVVEFDLGENFSGPIRRVFPLTLKDAPTHKYSAKIFGWQLGAFSAPTDVTVTAYSNTPDSLSQVESMEVQGVRDPYAPVRQYFIDFLTTDPVLGEKSFAKARKLIRKPRQTKMESPAFFVYTSDSMMMPILGSHELKYENIITITYLESVRNKREIDPNKHEIAMQRIAEHVANNEQLDLGLGLIVAFPQRGNIPFNTFEYVHMIQSSIDIKVEVIAQYVI